MDIGVHIVKFLETQGIKKAFTVPGESFLSLLCAFSTSKIQLINARQEGGASMMAEAEARITKKPGICMITRGPGMANAMAGLHVANQSQTPLLFLVGQVPTHQKGKGVFQEVDFVAHLKSVTKLTIEAKNSSDILPMIKRAYNKAINGICGPVAVILPEDLFHQESELPKFPILKRRKTNHKNIDDFQLLKDKILNTKKPFIIAGGGNWDFESCNLLMQFSEKYGIPVAVEFRRQGLFPNHHPNYAGDLTFATNPQLVKNIRESSLIILLGARLSDPSSQNFSLINQQYIVQISTDLSENGKLYSSNIFFHSDNDNFLSQMLPMNHQSNQEKNQWCALNHQAYNEWTETPNIPQEYKLSQGYMVQILRQNFPPDAIITTGAGNYAIWAQRYWRYLGYETQLGPISGTMGYSLPAAIVASLNYPHRKIIAMVGDGCMQMTMQELAVVATHKLPMLIIIVDNGRYGTIGMHQMRHYPNQSIGIDIQNPDFAMIAQAYGILNFKAETNEEFLNIIESVKNIQAPILIHCLVDKDEVKP